MSAQLTTPSFLPTLMKASTVLSMSSVEWAALIWVLILAYLNDDDNDDNDHYNDPHLPSCHHGEAEPDDEDALRLQHRPVHCTVHLYTVLYTVPGELLAELLVPEHDGADGVVLPGQGEPRPPHALPEPGIQSEILILALYC